MSPTSRKMAIFTVVSRSWNSSNAPVSVCPAIEVSRTWTARVEAVDHARTSTALATLTELRMCLSTAGDTNLAMTLWTRSPGEDPADRLACRRKAARLRLRENAINLRIANRMDWWLYRGRS